MNGAKGIRGKTLRYIVIDEAMLISNEIIESKLINIKKIIEEKNVELFEKSQSLFSKAELQYIKDKLKTK